MGAQNAKADLEEYRAGYPTQKDDPRQNDNLRFYKGQIKSVPSGDFIDTIHEKWWGNYAMLERHHGYIQWLFPIREHGMNMQSQVLQPHEINEMKADPECGRRLLRSYELMLDFFGMKLKNPETGELERAEDHRARYRNLNTSSHNYLRITRILKSLGELGFEHLKFNFLAFFAEEIWTHGQLKNCKRSLTDYWTGTLRDDAQRAEMEQRIRDYRKAAGEPEEEDRYAGFPPPRGGVYPQQRRAGASDTAAGRPSAGRSEQRAAAPVARPLPASDSDKNPEEDTDAQAKVEPANPPVAHNDEAAKPEVVAPKKEEEEKQGEDNGEDEAEPSAN